MSERPTTPFAKRAHRDRIQRDTERFIAGGGRIRQMSHGATCERVTDFDVARQRQARKAARKWASGVPN